MPEPTKRHISSGSLLVLNTLALLGLAGVIYLAFKSEDKQPSVEDFRKSYDGLSPEDMESYTGSESLH